MRTKPRSRVAPGARMELAKPIPCSAWVAELEADLRRLAKLRARNAGTMDAQSWKEMHEAGELLSKAWNRERRRSATVPGEPLSPAQKS